MNNLTFNINLKEFPSTRYQGSKRKMLPWLYKYFKEHKFDTVIDVFGGTGSVSYLFKIMGKQVTYNDYLKFNYYIGQSLIENNNIILTEEDIDFLLNKHKTVRYDSFVANNFRNLYYTEEENNWIDMFLCNWNNLNNKYSENVLQYKKSVAFYAFVQSALKKRPFNLFHRANLNLRLNEVERSFGNKTSWDGAFNNYFRCFVNEINNVIFNNNRNNTAINLRASDLKDNNYDLVYVDPPYIKKEASSSDLDYLKFYHFLEGACDLSNWEERIEYSSANRTLKQDFKNEWISKQNNIEAFDKLFNSFKSAKIIVSYKEPGIPSKQELIKSLKKYKRNVISVPGLKYSYALNKNNGFHKEYLLIAY